jgi:hypothetical protein
MKRKKPTYYKPIISILEELCKTYPSYGLGRHFSTAFSEYTDLWGVTDKELLFALEKYKAELQYDNPPHQTPEEELEKIIKDGLSLNLDQED